jgi:hypothetical protein
MTKEELRKHLEAQTERHTILYGNEIPVYAPKEPVQYSRKRLLKQMDNRKKPANLRQEQWEEYLETLGY